jgi:hypothetical protein
LPSKPRWDSILRLACTPGACFHCCQPQPLQALFSTGAKLSVRALAAGNQPMADIVFSFGAISLLGSAAMCASMPKAWVLPSELTTWLYIAAACALGYAVQVRLQIVCTPA